MRVTALVPYYSGYHPHAHSRLENRPGYLRQTVKSVLPLTRRIIVGAVKGEAALPDVLAGVNFFDCEPQLLPLNLLRWAQAELDGDLVYYTEADQVLHCQPSALQPAWMLNYLVPHRLEELGVLGEGADRGLNVSFDGRAWVLPNGAPHGTGLYHPSDADPETNRFLQYGGAWLATRELLARAAFTDDVQWPLEHAAGFAMTAAGHCMKTSDWQEFFVEHLSGHEHNERLGGR